MEKSSVAQTGSPYLAPWGLPTLPFSLTLRILQGKACATLTQPPLIKNPVDACEYVRAGMGLR